MANQGDLVLALASTQGVDNTFHAAAGRVNGLQIGVLLQHLFRHLARDIGAFVVAHGFKHPIAFALFAQVGAETYLAAFLTNKPINRRR